MKNSPSPKKSSPGLDNSEKQKKNRVGRRNMPSHLTKFISISQSQVLTPAILLTTKSQLNITLELVEIVTKNSVITQSLNDKLHGVVFVLCPTDYEIWWNIQIIPMLLPLFECIVGMPSAKVAKMIY